MRRISNYFISTKPLRQSGLCIAGMLIVLIIKLQPTLIWSFYIREAVHLMAAGAMPGNSSIRLLAVKNENSLDAALIVLEKANRIRPRYPLADRLAGRIYQAKGDWAKAEEVFNQALSDPKNDLALMRDMALSAAYWFHLQTDHLTRAAIPPSMIDSLEERTPFAPDLLAYGDMLLFEGQPAVADGAYRAARILYNSSTMTKSSLFRDLVLAVMNHQSNAALLMQQTKRQDATVVAYPLTNTVRLLGSDLRWFTPVAPPTYTFGLPLNYPYGGNQGFLWWNGQATSIISVQQQGNFRIEAKLWNDKPPPVEMVFGIDGHRLQNITLTKGDLSWQIFSYTIPLSEGFHTIDLWFLNDIIKNGENRDASIEWIDLKRVP